MGSDYDHANRQSKGGGGVVVGVRERENDIRIIIEELKKQSNSNSNDSKQVTAKNIADKTIPHAGSCVPPFVVVWIFLSFHIFESSFPSSCFTN